VIESRFEAALCSGRSGSFNAAEEAHNLQGYRREAAAEIEVEKAMITARSAMEQKRSEYLEAHRKLEVVRRLETKARTAHRLETNREEQAEFDDFATRRAARHEPIFSS